MLLERLSNVLKFSLISKYTVTLVTALWSRDFDLHSSCIGQGQ